MALEGGVQDDLPGGHSLCTKSFSETVPLLFHVYPLSTQGGVQKAITPSMPSTLPSKFYSSFFDDSAIVAAYGYNDI